MAKLFIFDVDGTLGTEEKILAEQRISQYRFIARRFKISIEAAKLKFIKAKKATPKKIRDSTVSIFIELGLTRKDYFKTYDKINPQGLIEPIQNCESTLKTLAKRHKVVAYTNTPRNNALKRLRILKITKYISKLYCSDKLSESKPSTKNLKKIMKDNGFNAKNTIMVGDSLEKDIIPAHELGITTILFDPEHKHKKTEEVDYLIMNLGVIVKIFKD